jgi:hypothetical protein
MDRSSGHAIPTHLLSTVDDEVPSLIIEAFAKVLQLLLRLLTQQAVLGQHHDGHAAQELRLVLQAKSSEALAK